MSMILAIDPGTDESGWVYYDPRRGASPIQKHGKAANELVLKTLGAGPTSQNSQVVIEQLEALGPRRIGNETLQTVAWANRFYQQALIHCHNPPTWIRRRDVRRHITGYSMCGDPEVRAALIDRFGPSKAKAIGTKKHPGPLHGIKGDEWPALALAITFAEQNKRGTG